MRLKVATRAAAALLPAAAVGVLSFLTLAPSSGDASQALRQFEQAEARDISGRITIEAARIHVLSCNSPGENGGTFYIYQYRKRPEFRAILPPNWSNAIGGRDYPTFEQAAAQACSVGVYLGCYRDSYQRDLAGPTIQANDMSSAKCMATCAAQKFAYAGTQYGSYCFCGNSYGGQGAASNCDMPCSGAPREFCGGSWANSVYRAR